MFCILTRSVCLFIESELEKSHISAGVVNVIWLETVALIIIRILVVNIVIIIIMIIIMTFLPDYLATSRCFRAVRCWEDPIVEKNNYIH